MQRQLRDCINGKREITYTFPLVPTLPFGPPGVSPRDPTPIAASPTTAASLRRSPPPADAALALPSLTAAKTQVWREPKDGGGLVRPLSPQ